MYGVSALVTVVALTIGGLSVYSLHAYVTAMSDDEVSHSLAAFEHSYVTKPQPDGGMALSAFTGQAPGTLIAVLDDGEVVASAVFSDDQTIAASPAAVASIQSQDWGRPSPRTVKLGDLGNYRVVSSEEGDGQRLVSAVSLESVNAFVATKTVLVVAISLAAAILAGIGTVVLLRWALRPLRRVAATASRAATLPLAAEDHRIIDRVRKADSDPDNEVGIVGETLNRLLANVDTALAARAASDRRMRRFLTDASHELRTPLTAILGYAELTRQESESLPATTEYALARIESESRRMTALVSDMLLLSRLDEGQGLEMERVELTQLVVDAVNDATVSAPDHEWLTELPREPLWLMGDKAQLHQLVSNLLGNARHHTPAGVIVRTALRMVGSEAELTVSDDGPGIDAKLLPELFGRFVRGNRSRSGEGTSTGLGLAIVASITEAHGGTVTAHSAKGSTVFRVLLPIDGYDAR
uniref:sensor histidine kinase n=1 Tax=unclassified Mycolicibacterium TaxID=2636767 RepID=UPI0024E1047A|nr:MULTISPECIES: HAMP domain-containing sensor histidine kinase [unclassified Mycolicibacterium]